MSHWLRDTAAAVALSGFMFVVLVWSDALLVNLA